MADCLFRGLGGRCNQEGNSKYGEVCPYYPTPPCSPLDIDIPKVGLPWLEPSDHFFLDGVNYAVVETERPPTVSEFGMFQVVKIRKVDG